MRWSADNLDEIITLALGLRQRSKAQAGELCGRFNEPDTLAPISAFNMVHNHAVMTAELLHYYKAVWSKKTVIAPELRDRILDENAQRVLEATKYMFLASLSAIEFSAKQALKTQPSLLQLDWTRRIYLSNILNESLVAGWIDDETNDGFKDLIFVRNCLVHNNGISDEDRELFNLVGKPVRANEGQMLQGDLKLFLMYTCYACESFQTWCHRFFEARSHG